MAENENKYKVRLLSTVTGLGVPFNVSPDFIENRNVNYKPIEPVHMPGQIFVYGGTSARTFNISNAKFISRTKEEATKTMNYLNMLRGWTMPYFGRGSSTLADDNIEARNNAYYANSKANRQSGNLSTSQANALYGDPGRQMLGAPPDILYLNAYSNRNTNERTHGMNIHKVPVIIQQLSIPYPSDVDYIPTTTGEPIPTIISVDITLQEAHSPSEYSENFNLSKYRKGILPNF